MEGRGVCTAVRDRLKKERRRRVDRPTGPTDQPRRGSRAPSSHPPHDDDSGRRDGGEKKERKKEKKRFIMGVICSLFFHE
jgi:hypothetical protein